MLEKGCASQIFDNSSCYDFFMVKVVPLQILVYNFAK